jgi:septal ring factor EnvC (AmiA/AmiB activator)
MTKTTRGLGEEIKRLRKEIAALKRAEKKYAAALQKSTQALSGAEARATESLEQQTATAEILKVISGTPTDAQPVFDTIVRNAGRVCDAVDAVLTLRQDDEMSIGAHWGPIGATVGTRFPLTRGSAMGRAIVDA